MALSDDEPRVRAAAALAVGRAKVAAAASRLTELMADEGSEVQRQAIASLGMLGGDAEAAVPALLDSLTVDDVDRRRSFRQRRVSGVSGGDYQISYKPIASRPLHGGPGDQGGESVRV